MALYRNILKQALQISWRYKYLWLFGMFASLLGSSGEYQIVNNIVNGNTGKNVLPSLNEIASTGVFSKEVFNYIIELFKTNPIDMSFATIGILLLIALSAFIIWLITISQAALVNESALVIKRVKGKTEIMQGFKSGAKKFWPVFGFNIISKILICICFVLIGIPFIISPASTSKIFSLSYILLFIIFVPIAIILAFIIKYAIAYSVISQERFIASLKKGWQLFLSNWLVSIEMAILLFFINFMAGLGIIMLILLLAIPLFFLALAFSYLFSFIVFWCAIILAGIIFLAIIVLGGSILTTFQIAAWTSLYIKLLEGGGISKIVRLTENMKK